MCESYIILICDGNNDIVVIVITGEVLGFESLVYGVFEFVHVLIDTSKFRTTVKSSVNDILYYVILYMQMTDDQVWKENNSLLYNVVSLSWYMRVSESMHQVSIMQWLEH